MNPELQKLVEYALADGYITDKEKQVLIKKAQNLGFDIDELEMILEGKLYEINKSSRPKVDKCPSCGEILSGLSRVCPSCDYVLYSESKVDIQTLDEMTRSLDSSITALRSVPKTGASEIFKSVLKIIFTAGLYIIYKKLIKKEALFDRHAYINERIIASTDSQAATLRTKYGDDQKINTYINNKLAERDSIIGKRQTGDAVTAVMIFIFYGALGWCFYYFATLPPGPPPPETPKQATLRHINAGRISEAKKSLSKVEDALDKGTFFSTIRDMEIDSLTNAKDYDGALKLIATIRYDEYVSGVVEGKIDAVVEKQVNDLITDKEFTEAKEKAGLASYSTKDRLLTLIKISESSYKSELKKEKLKNKKSRK
ncbi:zinc ribbon domain-containing protein [Flavobacterium subsaxonicum]|uniref:Uncharacterized protein n=1 Tax=Flavobacterium subsaxonicum WB 4.1-42 = DSM 21790 TaxID=1121898 RepID=A0A0A2MQM2_9FLAO|nr:zinc ribbon domain-containing protein [Flavobacterium subsaxonicum]KGO93743.1 hypothetical protein Q766_07250 [Flavobacterium subsaxonicum WB 4.1-42 = DSM 21790]